MEEWRCLATEEAERPSCDTEARPGGEGGEIETGRSVKVKKEELTDAPCKVPRFRYVDFPSLHQCIRQLAVPPLHGWLTPQPVPRGPPMTPVSSKDGGPKFKYVDYPSLHRCIQQLSVPPPKTWSSGLLRPQESDRGTRASPGALKRDWAGQNKSDTQARCPVSFPHRPQAMRGLSDPPKSSDKGRVQKEASLASDLPTFDAKPKAACNASSRTVAEVNANQESVPGIRCSDAESGKTWGGRQPEVSSPQSLEWGRIPESMCPFCQKMFVDPEELKLHQRQHRDKMVVTIRGREPELADGGEALVPQPDSRSCRQSPLREASVSPMRRGTVIEA